MGLVAHPKHQAWERNKNRLATERAAFMRERLEAKRARAAKEAESLDVRYEVYVEGNEGEMRVLRVIVPSLGKYQRVEVARTSLKEDGHEG